MQDRPNTARTTPGVSGPLDNSTVGQLAHLSEMDNFEIADGEPNIKGWDVRTMNGEKIGDVEDLIVDTALMKVRYIEVKLEKELAVNDERRHALIPIGSARLDDDKDDVLISLHGEQMMSLPAYVRGSLTREYETSLLDSFARPVTVRSVAQEPGAFYDGEYFDERRTFEGRRTPERRDDDYLRRLGD